MMSTDADTEAESKSVQERLAKLERENKELREMVRDLQAELEQRPKMFWPEESPNSLVIEHPDTGLRFPIGNAATTKLPGTYDEQDWEKLLNDVEALKRGEVDELDLVAGVDPEYPIENDLAKLGNEQLEADLTANEIRAAVIFRKFGGRAESWSTTMTLESNQARNILEEQRGEGSLNNNTVNRAMKMVATKTSTLPKQDRDPWDAENNLIWLAKGDKRLQLKADKSEFMEYLQEVEERFG